jgi:SWI/SNF-related matrix-associated actin-dependent regulator 1 of chromatin subfamily A
LIQLEQYRNDWWITFRLHFEPARLRLIKQLPHAEFKVPAALGCWCVPYSPLAVWLCHRLFPDPLLYQTPIIDETANRVPEWNALPDIPWLKPFQNAGMRFLLNTWDVLLADAPGLGKTFQAIGAGLHCPPCVVTAPASAIYMWRDMILEIDPLAGIAINNPDDRPHWMIYSHDQFHKYHKQILTAKPNLLIADEAHRFKNFRTKSAAGLFAVGTRTPRVICVTADPVINRIEDLFPLLVALKKVHRQDFWWFKERYGNLKRHIDSKRKTIVFKADGLSKTDELKEFLAPFTLRQTWASTGETLPPLTKRFLPVAIASPDYDECEGTLTRWFREHGATATLQNKLMRLNQLRRLGALAKLPALYEQMQIATESDLKSVIFCSFLEPLHRLYGGNYRPFRAGESVLIEGSQKPSRRHEIVREFQTNARIRYMLCSLEAGGVAITLNKASRVFFLDLPWTPFALKQGLARVLRRGQELPVEANYLLAMNSIDSVMAQYLQTKANLVGDLFDDEAAHRPIIAAIEEYLVHGPHGNSHHRYRNNSPDSLPHDGVYREGLGAGEVSRLS